MHHNYLNIIHIGKNIIIFKHHRVYFYIRSIKNQDTAYLYLNVYDNRKFVQIDLTP